MESRLDNLLGVINSTIRFKIINIICQSLLYGLYLCLFPVAVRAMVTNGLQSRARKCLLVTITFLFTFITAYWIFSVVFTFLSIDTFNTALTACYGSQNAFACLFRDLSDVHLPASAWLTMFVDALLVNFIIADGVVVWRAWVLCFDQSKVILMIPVVMLAINTVVYLITVVVRAIQNFFTKDIQLFVRLAFMINDTQRIQLSLSLVINIYATSIIALKAWRHRKMLLESGIGVRTPRLTTKILVVLVESGVVYILIGATTLASIIIFGHFKLVNIPSTFMLVSTHLVGMYPIVVVILVEKNRSLKTTYGSFSTIIDARSDRASKAEPISFAPGPVLASGGQIESAISSRVSNGEPAVA